MKILSLSLFAVMALAAQARLTPDPPVVCASCEAWNVRQEPFRVFGNTYSVGVAGLSSILIASNVGHVLLDGGLPQSAPLIAENIRTLGFRLADVRLILNSHAHFDHVGGIAGLQRASGATVAVSPAGARALRRGEPTTDDPQFALGRASTGFPSVSQLQEIADGEVLRVGQLTVTAHFTPGHTPGGTTWTWQSCEGTRCLNVVYADSLNAVAAPGFLFTGRAGLVDRFRRSIAAVAGLPCDILLSVHPEFSKTAEKLQRRQQGATPDAFIDPSGCREYAVAAAQLLNRRVAEEQSASQPQ